MPDTRIVKKIFKLNHLAKRLQGRSKYRREDNVKQDICQMKVKNWITCVQDRGKLKDVVEMAKTSKYWRKFSAWRGRRSRRTLSLSRRTLLQVARNRKSVFLCLRVTSHSYRVVLDTYCSWHWLSEICLHEAIEKELCFEFYCNVEPK